MRSETRFRLALVLALVAHGAAAAWTARAARLHEEMASRPSPPVEVTETDVLIEPSTTTTTPNETAAEPSTATTTPTAATDPRRAAAHAETAGAVVEAEPSAPSSEPAGDGSWTFAPGAPSSSPGSLSNGALGSAIRAGIAQTITQDNKKNDASKRILQTFTPEEYEHGLVPGNVWVGMTRDAVRRSRVPDFGSAILEFTTDATGIVATVRVLSSSSERDTWDEMATALTAQARSVPVHVPPGANGLAITLEIHSQMLTVTGGDAHPSTFGKILHAVNDPLGAATDSKAPLQRSVAVRVTHVAAF